MARLHNTNGNQAGFSLVEPLLVLVIIAAIVGVGYYVMHQRDNGIKLGSGTTAATKAAAGSTASVDQLTKQDAQVEENVDKGADAQTTQNATSANSSLNSVAGAYNETNL